MDDYDRDYNNFFDAIAGGGPSDHSNRTTGLPALDNMSLRGDGGTNADMIEPPQLRRSGRARRPPQDSISIEDDELEAASNNRRRRAARNEPVSWNYVSIDDFDTSKIEYDTSCDEIEFNELNAVDDEEEELALPRIDRTADENSNVVPSDRETEQRFNAAVSLPESSAIRPPRTNKRKRKNVECFGCKWSRSRKEEGRVDITRMNTLLLIIEENYGKIDNKALARACHLFFKHQIYLPCKGKIPMWRTKTILSHIEGHSLEPRIWIGESIKSFKRLYSVTEKMLLREERNETGESHVVQDSRSIAALLAIHKRIEAMYKINPRTLNFWNDDCKIDFNHMGKLVSLHKNFTTK